MIGISREKIMPPEFSSEKIKEQKEAFLAGGGKIQVIPIGVTALNYGSGLSKDFEEKQKNGILAASKKGPGPLRIGKRAQQDR